MAKKKSKTKQENNVSVSYSGEVIVSLEKNNRIYNTKKFKNSGRVPLFKFLADCIAGRVSDAMQSRPQYVELFHIGNYGADVPQSTFSELATESNVRTSISTLYSGAINTEVTEATSSSEGDAYATIKFLVPMSIINYVSQGTDDGAINMIALYSETNKPVRGAGSTDFSKASAYVILIQTDSQGQPIINPDTGREILDQLIVPQAVRSSTLDNYNIVIQWKMIIKN